MNFHVLALCQTNTAVHLNKSVLATILLLPTTAEAQPVLLINKLQHEAQQFNLINCSVGTTCQPQALPQALLGSLSWNMVGFSVVWVKEQCAKET